MTSSKTLKLFAYIQMSKRKIIARGELQKLLNITQEQEQRFLEKLAASSTIIRLLPGTYLVPQKIPPGGKWQPDALYVISEFTKLIQANYYVTGLYAFNYYGLSEQIPNQLSVYNDKLSATRIFGTLRVKFIKVPNSKIGSIEKIELNDDSYAYISSLSRTIVDAIHDWKRFGTMPDALEWISNLIKNKSVLENIISDTIAYGNVSTKRRIGYYLFKCTNESKLSSPILKTLKSTTNWVVLNPAGNRSGITNKTWRIIDNVTTSRP